MNVETSKHDELWTTRRRVMMNVDMKHWRRWLVMRRRLWSCRSISSDERSSVTNRPWQRSLGTTRTTATVTTMTYNATCHRERVHSTTAGLWRTADVHVHSDRTCTWTLSPVITRHPSLLVFGSIFRVQFFQKQNKKSKKQNVPQ